MYLTSQDRPDLLQRIMDYDVGTEISQNLYYNYRAALVGEVIFRNAQRSGTRYETMRSTGCGMTVRFTQITIYNHKTLLFSEINWQEML